MSDVDALLGPVGGEERAALVDAETGEVWSYSQLRAAAGAVRDVLADQSPGLVAWLSRSRLDRVAAYLGSLESHHAVLPMSPNLSAEAKRRILDAYRPELLVAGREDELPTDEAYEAVPLLGETSVWRRREPEPSSSIHPDLKLLLSTSGSTGSPRMVRLTARNVLSNAHQIARALSIDPAERAVTSLPLFYSFGLSVLHSHLVAGASVLLQEGSVVEPTFWEAVDEFGVTSISGVPQTFAALRRVGFQELAPTSVRTLAQAGGKMPVPLIEHFHRMMLERGGVLFVMYGQTEATARISVLPPAQLPQKMGSVGAPLEGGVVDIDRSGSGSQADDIGEIVYRGPNVMMGYAQERRHLTRGDELQGTLRTGDLGYLDEDGVLYIRGRIKRIAKVFGNRVNLDDIEDQLADVGPLAVIDSEGRLVVFVLEPKAQLAVAAIDQLSREMRLHTSAFGIMTLDELPLLSNGKVDYAGLARLAEDGSGP